MFESLETRRLMSVAVMKVHSDLFIWGDSNANGISVQKSGVQLVVKEYQGAAGYQPIFSLLASSVNHLQIFGYDGPDTITINDNVKKSAVVMGGRGGDYLKAGGGDTTLHGQGNWQSDPSGSHRSTTDDNAADMFVSGKGESTMIGQGGNDLFTFNQQFVGGKEDIAYGGNGNDTFNLGGTRHVVAIGDNGGDTFKVAASNPSAFLNGGDAVDTVDFAAFGVAVYAKNDGVQMSGPRFGFDGERNQKVGTTVETIMGTPFGDSMSSNNSAGNIFGQGGDDILYGNGGADFIDGGIGNDTIYGHDGNDILFGREGNDKLFGADGNDFIFGHAGKDSLYGQNGNDQMWGGDNDDELRGGANNDQLYGEAGGDHLYGEGGANLLVGGTGSDFLVSKNGSALDFVFGDNQDGTGSNNAFDIAVVDLIVNNGGASTDTRFGVESVSF